MLSLWNAIGIPSTRVPINAATMAWYVLPPTIGYFVAAVLAVTHQTRIVRIALWPVIALLALRAALSLDTSLGEPGQKSFNISFVSYIFAIVTRTLDWALEKEPFIRHLRPSPGTLSTALVDALDLLANFRGIGWNWSHGLHIPRDTRPTGYIPFALHAFLSGLTHGLISGISHRALLSFVRVGPDAIQQTILDESLPVLARYLRASIITTLAAWTGYTSLQTSYNIYTAGLVILGRDPVQFPAAFDAPWRATSLADFWGRRWHQWHRRVLLTVGGYPLSVVFGRPGALVGAFLLSAVLHHLVLHSLNPDTEFWRMLVGFGMMGPGILAERGFYRVTGKRVGGVIGWMWTMLFLLLFANVLAEGCARAGGFGDSSTIDDTLPPVRMWVERLVTDFDIWLHTISQGPVQSLHM